MKSRILFISSILFLTFSIQSLAQTYVNAINQLKVSVYPFIGISVFPDQMNYNALGISKNIFGGYVAAPVIGAAIRYKILPKFFVGFHTSFLFTSRESNSLNMPKFGLIAKYNIVNPQKHFLSPYILAGINLTFLNIDQSKQVREFYPNDSTAFGEGFKPVRVDYKFNQLQMTMSPIVGPIFGGGVEAKVTAKISLFVQATFESSFGTNEMIMANYPENTSLLNLASIQIGTSIRFFKNVKIQIDTMAVYIPDLISQLSPIAEDNEHIVESSRENDFQINLREGIRKVIPIQKNGEVNLDLEEYNSPCEKRVTLFDADGYRKERYDAVHNEQITFKNLKKGIYNVVIELEPPCTKKNISYWIDEQGNKLLNRQVEDSLLKSESIMAARNKIILDKLSSDNVKMYSFYNIEGDEEKVSGYGYQVGAFINLGNALHLMNKLTKDGFRVYTQAIYTDDINLRFKTSINYKFHRVLVFAGLDETRAYQIQQTLLKSGYEIIVKEDFTNESKYIIPVADRIKFK